VGCESNRLDTDGDGETGLKAIRNGDAVRRLVVGFACLGASALLSGCFHRQAPATVPAVLQAPPTPPPTPAAPDMASDLPPDVGTVPPVKVTEIRPRRPLKRTTPKSPASETSAPVDTASAGVPEESPIGELSAGGDSNPQTQQDAAALIAATERRLSGFSPASARQQQEQLRKVRYFLKQARQALSSGDAEGARTLATKAKLLLEDLAK
jgi:hypothetical protein